MHSLKLIYFKMRALAEAPQMLMKFADLNYEYLMSWDYFDDDWEMVKPTIPFQQLPILVVDDEHQIAQSTSIMRFLQRLADMEPQDPVVAAKADAILESAQELLGLLIQLSILRSEKILSQKKNPCFLNCPLGLQTWKEPYSMEGKNFIWGRIQ